MDQTYSVGIYQNAAAKTLFLIAGLHENVKLYGPGSLQWKTIAEPIHLGKNIGTLVEGLTGLSGEVIPPHPAAERLYVGTPDDLIMARLNPTRLDDVRNWLSGLYGQEIGRKE